MAKKAAVSAAKREHGLLLAGWLVLIIVSTLASGALYLFEAKALAAQIDVPVALMYLYGVVSLVSALLVFYIFSWKKIAFYGYVVMVFVIFALNVIVARLGLLAISGFIGLIITYLLLRPKWKLLE
jgi:hypothetical protein